MHACLRGGEEHRSLRFNNFSRHSSPERWVYVENCSKNRQGGLAHLPHKEVPIFQCPDAGNRCPVKILDEYVARVPPDAIKEDAAFYLRPLPGTLVATVWFAKQPIGKHLLSCMVKTACEEAQVYGKTNHSLRATGATMMFQACVPEKIIKEFTGHRSSDGVRRYERTPVEHQQAVSSILASKDEQSFDGATKLMKNPELSTSLKRHVPVEEKTQTPCTPLPGKYSFSNCNVTFYMGEPPNKKQEPLLLPSTEEELDQQHAGSTLQ